MKNQQVKSVFRELGEKPNCSYETFKKPKSQVEYFEVYQTAKCLHIEILDQSFRRGDSYNFQKPKPEIDNK